MKGYANYGGMEHFQEFFPSIGCKKTMIKNHLGHTWYGFETYKPFPLVIFANFKVNCSCVF
jgi:hypothetical protein